MGDQQFDVIVVGLGPVGSFGALLLAEEGLRVAAIERDPDVYALPRAVNLDGEIVRALQRIGRGDAVDALLQKVRPGERAGFANSRREWMFGADARDFGPHGWQPMNMFDQPELEGWLRNEAVAHPNVTAFIGSEAAALADHGDGVTVALRPAGDDASAETTTLSARWLIGCDGAASLTRRTLGIGWRSLGYDHDWLVVDVTIKDGHTLGVDTIQVCDPDRLATYVCTKDPYRRWEFRINADETKDEMLDPERIHQLIDPWTPRDTYEIRRAATYTFHAANAESWREGNVFLAGDAAHQTPPFLGQGMNTGMRDVVNLAWKLALVQSGEASVALLDSYESERDPHAKDLVDWAVSIGRLMEHLADVERAERDGLPAPEPPAELRSAGYGQGRGQPPLRDGLLHGPQLDGERAGVLLRQPIVVTASGDQLRLDELLGPGFALVGRPDAELVLDEHALDLADRLGVRVVSLHGVDATRGHFDALFDHTDAVLVRPDRVVFGVADETASVGDLLADLHRQLRST